MELSELRNRICDAFVGDKGELARILDWVEQDHSVFPFNEYEHLLHHLIHECGVTFEKYLEIRTEYIASNPNLWVFEISAPRGFGEKFAQTHISGMCADLQKPSRALDSSYSGEYDFWLDGIRVEVKASRAVESDSEEPLYVRALAFGTKSKFLMNFQQLKPDCCDVFVWLAVFRDYIAVWVMNSKEVEKNKYFSKGQHRGNHGNEGQLHMKHDNIAEFEQVRLKDGRLKEAIVAAKARG